jgi:hypothetical protein
LAEFGPGVHAGPAKVQAQAILQELRDAMADWRDIAQRSGLSGVEVARMESVIQA